MGDCLKEENISLTTVFDEQCPYYLAIGMTYNEFWIDNPYKVKYYKEALKIKSEIRRYEIWEQGAYFYDSLCKTSVLFRDLIKGNVKPQPYPEKPYGVGGEEFKSEEQIEQEIENERLKAQIHFKMLFKEIANRFENDKAGEKDNGK